MALGSAREGTETVVALRFRGRAVVSGTVLAADGVTLGERRGGEFVPRTRIRANWAAALFRSKRTLCVLGVPLEFTVQATAPSGQFRTVAGLLDRVGETRNLTIVLSSNVVTLAALRGRVFEPDTITPHPNAHVFVGRFDEQNRFVDVVAAVTADADGFWIATNFPAGNYDVAAVRLMANARATGANQATPAIDTQVKYPNGRTTVSGRVEFLTACPRPRLVAGGDTIVRTDAQGLFTLTVPTGNRPSARA